MSYLILQPLSIPIWTFLYFNKTQYSSTCGENAWDENNKTFPACSMHRYFIGHVWALRWHISAIAISLLTVRDFEITVFEKWSRIPQTFIDILIAFMEHISATLLFEGTINRKKALHSFQATHFILSFTCSQIGASLHVIDIIWKS